ncbi:MAG: hypothetical protein D6729_12785 [Deltaproteobacteria bacterium]|nr:MAG: hypothetical protein D6729_12785 [Deltaproteobacteria bacterium]
MRELRPSTWWLWWTAFLLVGLTGDGVATSGADAGSRMIRAGDTVERCGQQGESIDATQYRSSCGEDILFVAPRDRFGSEGMECVLQGPDGPIWSMHVPFIITAAAVGSDGQVVALMKPASEAREDRETAVVSIDSGGNWRLFRRDEVLGSRGAGSGENLILRGVLALHGCNEFVLRASRPSDDSSEVWLAFDPSEGHARGRAVWTPDVTAAAQGGAEHVEDVVAVPGTDLLLVHWIVNVRLPSGSWSSGACFGLVDEEGHLRWRLDLPQDYDRVAGSPDSFIRGWVDRYGGIADVRHRSFSIRSYRDGLVRSFDVHRDGTARSVRVSERPEPLPFHPWIPSRLERIDLQPARVETVPRASGAPRGRSEVLAWNVKGEQATTILLSDPRGGLVVRELGPAGIVVREIPVQGRRADAFPRTLRWHSAGDGLFLGVAVDSEGVLDGRMFRTVRTAGGEWRLETGEISGLPRRESRIHAIDGGLEGYLLVVGEDEEGKPHAWQIEPTGVVAHDFLAAVPDVYLLEDDLVAAEMGGGMAVVDTAEGAVYRFDRDGRLRARVELNSIIGRADGYWIAMESAPDGGLVVVDGGEEGGLLYLQASDTPQGRWVRGVSPEGEPFSCIAARLDGCAHGRVVLRTDEGLYEVGREGVIVPLITGRSSVPPRAVGHAAVLENGMLVVEDPEGRRLVVWKEDMSSSRVIEGDEYDASVAAYAELCEIIAGQGETVWLTRDAQDCMQVYPHLGPSWSIAAGGFGGAVSYVGPPDRTWVWCGFPGELRLWNGKEWTQVVRTRPDGKWLHQIAGVAIDPRDGGLAVLEHSERLDGPWFWWLHCYGSEGQPDGSIDVSAILSAHAVGAYLRHVGGWILMGGRGSRVVLTHERTRRTFLFDAARAGDEPSIWAHGLSSDGKRLLSVDARRGLVISYVLPQIEGP